MAHVELGRTGIDAPILDLVTRERNKALSLREWKFRLAGYGYAIKEVAGIQILTTLPHGVELGALPVRTV